MCGKLEAIACQVAVGQTRHHWNSSLGMFLKCTKVDFAFVKMLFLLHLKIRYLNYTEIKNKPQPNDYHLKDIIKDHMQSLRKLSVRFCTVFYKSTQPQHHRLNEKDR